MQRVVWDHEASDSHSSAMNDTIVQFLFQVSKVFLTVRHNGIGMLLTKPK